MTLANGLRQRSSRSCVICWNCARVIFSSRCSGPSALAVMYGRLIVVSADEDSSIFAFSADSRRRWSAILSLARSIPWALLNCLTRWSTRRWSQSSPPRWLSPEVALTSMTPSPISSSDTSNVPPPRSKTRIVCSLSPLSSPYASAAAVGSLTMRRTLRPAISPASLVAWRWASLKYAGTVTTASIDGLTEVGLRVALELLQDERADLLRRKALAVDLGRPVGADVTLDGADGALDVGHGLTLRDLADEDLAGLGEGHHGRGRPRSLRVGDDGGLATLEDGDDRVGRSQVDTDGTGHGGALLAARDG